MQDRQQYLFAKRISENNNPAYISAKLFCKYLLIIVLSFIIGIFAAKHFEATPFVTFKSEFVMNPDSYNFSGFVEYYKLLLNLSLFDLKIFLLMVAGAFTLFGAFVSSISCFIKGAVLGVNCVYLTAFLNSQGKMSAVIAFAAAEILIGLLFAKIASEGEKFSLGSRNLIASKRSSEFLKLFFGLLISFMTSMGALLIINCILMLVL